MTKSAAGVTVADTAKWVAMYRAMESERPDALFQDPYARKLAGNEGEDILARVPRARQFAWPMILRTVMIDEILTDAIASRGVDTIVNLAAGFDARPYRMNLPPALQWVEIDYPRTIEAKGLVLANETPRCKLERIGADLADATARREILARVNATAKHGLFLTEGLMVYLRPEQAAQLSQDLAAQDHFEIWVTDIVAPFILKMMKRYWAKSLAAAPFLFAPAEGAGFYASQGWKLERYRSTFLESRKYGREPKSAWVYRLLYPRFARQEINRTSGPMTGVVVLAHER